MKHLFYNILFIACALLCFACGAEDDPAALGGKGYLRLSVGQSNELTTKADEEYKFDRIEVFIKDSEGQTKKHTTDFAGEWKDTEIELEAGEYTIEARSYGWDGEAGEDKAYYEGSEKVTIESGKPATAEVKCYLANVKVTVAFEQAFLDALGTGSMSVQIQNKSDNATYVAKDFKAQAGKQVCYFAATDLDIHYTVTNAEGKKNEATKELRDVKPKTHYLVTFKLPQQGQGDFTVTVDGTMTQYECTITVNPNDASAAVLSANPWAKFAYLTAESVNPGGADISSLKFQYREKDTETWTDAEATEETDEESNKFYTGKTGELEPATKYEYRLASADGKSFTTPAEEFTTEAATVLYNGSFEFWTTGGNGEEEKETIYPGSSEEAGNTTSFWNTSNPGTSQGLAASIIAGGPANPTTGVTSPVKAGTYAAKLMSTNKLSVFAAASLYTGKFNGLDGMSANMEFGQSFTARPIALHGYYQYTPQVINHVDKKPDGVTIEEGKTMDQCAIFIALATKSFQFNNKKEEEYIDYANDPAIIAYGELPSGAAAKAEDNNGYVEFNIPLKYKSLTEKPTHIIIVCAASKYGDYMTGADNSTLYVDDFSLVYDGEPEIWVKE